MAAHSKFLSLIGSCSSFFFMGFSVVACAAAPAIGLCIGVCYRLGNDENLLCIWVNKTSAKFKKRKEREETSLVYLLSRKSKMESARERGTQ